MCVDHKAELYRASIIVISSYVLPLPFTLVSTGIMGWVGTSQMLCVQIHGGSMHMQAWWPCTKGLAIARNSHDPVATRSKAGDITSTYYTDNYDCAPHNSSCMTDDHNTTREHYPCRLITLLQLLVCIDYVFSNEWRDYLHTCSQALK